MRIENVVSHFLENIPIIRNKDGEVIASSQFLSEYKSLKSYCLSVFQDDSIVAIQLDKDYKYLISILVCMEIGLTYVPLHIDFPGERVNQIKHISNFEKIINDDVFDSILKESYMIKNKINSFSLDVKKVLYIMFTSGSTGEPKGVVIKRESYQNFLTWLDVFFNINEDDIILNTTEFTFDVSLVDIGLLLVKHASIVFSNFQNNIFKFLLELENFKITTIATVPNNFSMILTDDLINKVDLSNLKYSLIAGSKFSYNLYENLKKYLPSLRIYNCYGPTEFTIYCFVKELGIESDISKSTVSIGRPILNTKFKIVDDDLNCVKSGVEGELLVSGLQLMQGYKNNHNETSKAIVKIDNADYYRTGDIAFFDQRNNSYIVGRKDDTVKISGFRVNLSDVDAYIHKLTYIQDSYTIVVDGINRSSYLVSYVALNDKMPSSVIIKDLKAILPSFQMPKYIEIIRDFPLNTSGKICTKTLQMKFKDKYSAPTN
jgi:acyl-coenzyme A synthetase/AMP-(fatty) acid ligase